MDCMDEGREAGGGGGVRGRGERKRTDREKRGVGLE